ncbi:MAG TPA: histidine kinase [Ktedonobacterales bacterium]
MRDVDDSAPQAANAQASSRRSVVFAAMTWLIWLLYMVPVTASLFASHPSPLRLVGTLAGAAIFIAIYAWTAWHNAKKVMGFSSPAARESSLALWLPILAMLALSLVLTAVSGAAWGALFIYTCAAAAGRLSARQALELLALVLLLTLIYGWRTDLPASITLSDLSTIIFAGITTIAMVFAVTTSRRWREERAELARFASVTEERLRIARDLHDLLGHSLSLIALKSDLAQQLLPIAPERAATEVADIERAAREALHEVREAVAGYRRPTLAAELHEARRSLAAASIAFSTRIDEHTIETLPRATETALSWAVREGVTNVIRHSHARHCEVRLAPLGGEELLEIDDDGEGSGGQAAAGGATHGNGLRGLAERVTAAGGRCSAGPRPEGGFSLRVWMPATVDESTGPQAVEASQDSASASEPDRGPSARASGAAGEIAQVTPRERGERV